MKNIVTVLFAGAFLATAALAQGSNTWVNDLQRAKTGRVEPVAEQQAPPAADKGCGTACCDHQSQKSNDAAAHHHTAPDAAPHAMGCGKS